MTGLFSWIPPAPLELGNQMSQRCSLKSADSSGCVPTTAPEPLCLMIEPTHSTPVRQPTTAQQGVADLHALLIAAKERGPYVLVGHSWGGLIARLFASTYPDAVVGLVFVDPALEFLKNSLTPAQWETYIKATKKLIESNDLERVTTNAASICCMVPREYAQYRLSCSPRTSDSILVPEGRRRGQRGETLRIVSRSFSMRSTSATRAAVTPSRWSSLNLWSMQSGRSSKQFVAGAIRWRTTKRISSCLRSPKFPYRARKALDEGFAKSGLPGVITGLWISSGNWIGSRGVANFEN